MSSKKRKQQSKKIPSSKEVYCFMLDFAQEISDDRDIAEVGFCLHTREYDYALRLVEEKNKTKDSFKKTYGLYACDKYGEHHFGKPFVTGSLDDVITYLKDEDNTDIVMLSVYEKVRKRPIS